MSLTSEITRGSRRAIDAGSADLDRLRGRVGKNIRRVRNGASRRAVATNRYVHDHPWMSIAMIAGAAAVAGAVAGRALIRER